MNAIVRNKVALRLLSLVTGNDFLCSRVSIGRKRKTRGKGIVLIEGSGVSGWRRLRKIPAKRCGGQCDVDVENQRGNKKGVGEKEFLKREESDYIESFWSFLLCTIWCYTFVIYFEVLYSSKKSVMYMRSKFKGTARIWEINKFERTLKKNVPLCTTRKRTWCSK